MSIFSGNALWQLVKQSDAVSAAVLLVLLFLSITCWTIFLYKIVINRLKQKQLDEFLSKLLHVRSIEELLALHAMYANTLAGYFIIKILKYTEWYIEMNQAKGITGLTANQAEMIESQSYQLIDEIVTKEEAGLPILSVSFAVSPLLGLFGTVWGLIQAFMAIGEKQSADIAAVAPGIAQALTTTLAGLLVAIPAFVMFSYLSWQLKSLEQKLMQFADRSVLVIQKLLMQ